MQTRSVHIAAGPQVVLAGDLGVPAEAAGIVLFAHGSGSSRHSTRNQYVARQLYEAGLATLLFDLLTEDEEAQDRYTGHLRFDLELLSRRLLAASDWVMTQPALRGLRMGYFGASTGGGAALMAAAKAGIEIGAVVSRGGRPDLAKDALPQVRSPTLLIVGGRDTPVIEMNRAAYAELGCVKALEIVAGASHLFEEPGALEQVARLAVAWFKRYLQAPAEAVA